MGNGIDYDMQVERFVRSQASEVGIPKETTREKKHGRVDNLIKMMGRGKPLR